MRRDDAPGGGLARRTLVTGGSGFIGSHLVSLLLARGDHVVVVDNLSTGRRGNLPGSHARLRFVEADLSGAIAAFSHERFDEIYHLAAAVGVKLVTDDPILAVETNVGRTLDLLRFAFDRAPSGGASRHSRVLVVSSSEVYGKGTKSPFSEDDDVVYGPTTIARWCYGCSKAIDEYLSLAYHRRDGLPVSIVRLFNTVGPGQVGDYGMVLPRFVQAALEGVPLEVYGDGAQTRCFCDVRDVAAAMPRVLANDATAGRVFNLGSDRSMTILSLAELVIRTLGSASGIRMVPYDRAYSPGFEDLRDRKPDLTRIREAIGWKPSYEIETTIRDLAKTMASTAHEHNAESLT